MNPMDGIRGTGLYRHYDRRDFSKENEKLYLASYFGSLADVKSALESGAAVDKAVQEDGVTVLHMAAYHGNDAMVDLLLKHGANPSVRDRWNRAPADLAIDTYHFDLADKLTQLECQQITARKRKEAGLDP